jgi:hypothetical protein
MPIKGARQGLGQMDNKQTIAAWILGQTGGQPKKGTKTVEKLTSNKKEPAVASYRPEGDYTNNNTYLSSTSLCVKGKGLEAGSLFDRVYQVKGVARKFYFLSDSADWLKLSGKELKQALGSVCKSSM